MDLGESVRNQTDASLSLTKHLISAHAKDSNLVFSPLSINLLLGLIAAGSSGPTRDQLLGFLNSESVEELNSLSSRLVALVFADGEPLGGPRLSLANGVWVDQSLSLKPSFRDIAENAYGAASNHVDFQTKADEVREEVNTWIEKETKGLIKDLLPSDSVDADTRLILANALHFKGAWTEKFDTSKTEDHEFFLLDGSSIQAPFMTSNEKQYIRCFNGFKVLELTYQQGEDERQFSMHFFLPDTKDGLPSLVEKLGSQSGFIENHLTYRQVKVGDFRIPKFKIRFGLEASAVLKELGLVLPFSGGGLTEMVDSGNGGDNLFVSRIIHESFIEVNEEGTEAAAASAGLPMPQCLWKDEKLNFVADHPFLFVIRESLTGVVLFLGQVLNPLGVD